MDDTHMLDVAKQKIPDDSQDNVAPENKQNRLKTMVIKLKHVDGKHPVETTSKQV